MKHKRLPMPWRVALMAGAATALWLVVQSGVSAMFGEAYTRETHIIRALAIFALAVPMVILARRYLDKDPSLAKLGLQPLSRALKPFGTGMLAWLVPAGLGVGVCVLTGMTAISTGASPGAILLNLLSLLVLVFIFEAFPEELIFRGYIFQNIAGTHALWVAVVVQSLLFSLWGMFNGGPITLDRIVLFLVFGTLLGIVRAITGSVWATIGYHLAFQTVAQFFGSVGGQIHVQPPESLALIAFGVLPCALSVPVLRRFYKKPVNWRA